MLQVSPEGVQQQCIVSSVQENVDEEREKTVDLVESNFRAFGIGGDSKAIALMAGAWLETAVKRWGWGWVAWGVIVARRKRVNMRLDSAQHVEM